MEKLEIGIEIAPEHAYGRAFAEGVSVYAVGRKNWKLRAISQQGLTAETFRSCDGVILRVLSDRIERLAQEYGTPVVDIGYEKPRTGIAQVSSDESAAGRLAAEFALSRSFVNFGYCGVNALPYSDRCLAAFSGKLAESGHSVLNYTPPPKLCGQQVFDLGSPYRTPDASSIRKWLKSLPKPIAIFCCNDHRAYQLMSVALKVGYAVPGEIGILGCDNDTMLCSFAQVPISSIDPDAYRVGFTAARVLDALIAKPPRRKVHRPVLVPPKGIVERESTEFIPIEPRWLSEAILLIERELESGLSAERIFALSGHSAPHVEKVFREKLGVSVQTYITNARMKRARALLRDGRLSTKEIAAACGYASPQYFCRVFKELFGFSPQKLSGHPPAS